LVIQWECVLSFIIMSDRQLRTGSGYALWSELDISVLSDIARLWRKLCFNNSKSSERVIRNCDWINHFDGIRNLVARIADWFADEKVKIS
jgi:hypothetical protein